MSPSSTSQTDATPQDGGLPDADAFAGWLAEVEAFHSEVAQRLQAIREPAPQPVPRTPQRPADDERALSGRVAPTEADGTEADGTKVDGTDRGHAVPPEEPPGDAIDRLALLRQRLAERLEGVRVEDTGGGDVA